ncbi:hypothetical protein CC2G_008301 [Coprinopsis cinerea AmutBmut pab1-1]|nr:hypothetical protein CC2G_008301 [Coprinopsis cinerea AmutBmut pab1-1]
MYVTHDTRTNESHSDLNIDYPLLLPTTELPLLENLAKLDIRISWLGITRLLDKLLEKNPRGFQLGSSLPVVIDDIDLG